MLTPLELDIMKAVWQQAPVTVKDVQAAIRPQRRLAYTTVMTLMHRLYHKGFLSRKLRARAHIYEPAVAYIEVRDAEISRLIDNFFSGSRENLIDFLDRGLNGQPPPNVRIPSNSQEFDETLL